MIRFLIFTIVFLPHLVNAQKVVFDRNHFAIVNENGAVRLAAESTHNSYLKSINARLDDVNLNISAVTLIQGVILNSLTQVNQALKSGIVAKQITEVGLEIIKESSDLIAIANDQPHFLLFAEQATVEIKQRGLRLISEVSDFIIKDDASTLINFEKRDDLLRKILLELRVMRTLIFSMQKSIYWAKHHGILKTVNPYRNYISMDKRLIDGIVFNYGLLKK